MEPTKELFLELITFIWLVIYYNWIPMGCCKSKEQREAEKIVREMEKAVKSQYGNNDACCCKSKEQKEREKAMKSIKNMEKMFGVTVAPEYTNKPCCGKT